MNGSRKLPSEYLADLKSKFTTKTIISILLLFAILAVYFVVAATNFTTLSFDFSRVQSKDFWLQYSLVIALGILVMVLVVFYKKMALRDTGTVGDLKQELFELKGFIDNEGMGASFKEYLVMYNRKVKLETYKDRLLFLKSVARKQETINKYDKLLETADKDIDNMKVNYRKTTENTIFNGIKSRSKGRELNYSGFEGSLGAVLPALIFGVFLQGVVLSAVFSAKSSSIDSWINTIFTFCTMSFYMIRGLSFATYNVNIVFYGVLVNRRSVVLDFFAEKGLTVDVSENENYKYKIKTKPLTAAEEQK